MEPEVSVTHDRLDVLGRQCPAIVVKARNLRQRFPGVGFHMFGDENRILPLMKRRKRLKRLPRSRTQRCYQQRDESLGGATQGRQSSMQLAINACETATLGVVSAGNTGALMAMAKLALRDLARHRPAIAAIFPTMRARASCSILAPTLNAMLRTSSSSQLWVMYLRGRFWDG